VGVPHDRQRGQAVLAPRRPAQLAVETLGADPVRRSLEDRGRDLGTVRPDGVEVQPFVPEIQTVAPRTAHEHDLAGIGTFDGATKQILVQRQRWSPRLLTARRS